MVFAGAEESACSRLARLDSKLSSVIVIRDLLATDVKRMKKLNLREKRRRRIASVGSRACVGRDFAGGEDDRTFFSICIDFTVFSNVLPCKL